MHVFADLRPYICTYNDCKLKRTTFPSRELWAEHEWEQHRSRSFSRCRTCNTTFDLAQDYLTHVEMQHHRTQPIDAAQREMLLLAVIEHVVEDVGDQLCNICTRTGFKTKRDFDSHVARHMEEIALITLPRDIDSDNESANEGFMEASIFMEKTISTSGLERLRALDNTIADEDVTSIDITKLPQFTTDIETPRESATAVNNEDGLPEGLPDDEKDGERATFRSEPSLSSAAITLLREGEKRRKNTAAARKSRMRKQEEAESKDAEIQRLRDMTYRLGGDPDES